LEPKEKEFIFYQVSPIILNKFGPDVACVHAVIRNKSHKEGYVCQLSESAIGNEIKISYKRVEKSIRILLENKYIELIEQVNKYGTKSYRYISEMVDHGLRSEDKVTLKCNNARIADPRDERRRVNKGNSSVTKHPYVNDGYDVPSQDDVTSRPSNKPIGEMNHNGIKNLLKELNKEIKEPHEILKKSSSTPHQIIKNKIEKALNIVADDSRWEKFINFVYKRETDYNQPLNTFLTYAIREGFDPLYWTPEKMQTMYPRAFINVPFVKALPPPPKEEKYAPMPEKIFKKREGDSK